MAKHLVTDTFELNGRWWLPGHDDKAIAGTLHYSPDAIRFKLHGVLTTTKPLTGFDILRSMAVPEDEPEDNDIAAVFGETKDGAWSLLNAFSTSTSIGWSGVGDCTYSANLLVQGGHVSSLEPPCTDIWFGSTLHERFFKLPIFEVERSPVGEPWSRTMKHVGCSKICYQTEPTEELRLNASISESPNLHSIEIRNNPYFRLIASAPQPLRRQLDRMWSICNLFTLLTDDVVAPTYCDVRLENEKESLRVFYTARDRIRSKTPKAVLPLLKMDNVESILESALQRWLAAEGQVIGSAILLFLEGRENNYPSIEGQFLVLTQGLEAISRATMTSEYMTDADYNQVRQALYTAIPATVDPSHRASLRNRIKYGNGHLRCLAFSGQSNSLFFSEKGGQSHGQQQAQADRQTAAILL
jgi:hypothetical protein